MENFTILQHQYAEIVKRFEVFYADRGMSDPVWSVIQAFWNRWLNTVIEWNFYSIFCMSS